MNLSNKSEQKIRAPNMSNKPVHERATNGSEFECGSEFEYDMNLHGFESAEF
jgi:hypothetical protein